MESIAKERLTLVTHTSCGRSQLALEILKELGAKVQILGEDAGDQEINTNEIIVWFEGNGNFVGTWARRIKSKDEQLRGFMLPRWSPLVPLTQCVVLRKLDPIHKERFKEAVTAIWFENFSATPPPKGKRRRRPQRSRRNTDRELSGEEMYGERC